MKKFILISVFVVLFIGCKSVSYIEFTTKKNIGDEIELSISADKKDQKNIWIDMNNNKRREEYEKITYFGEETKKYQLKDTIFRVYGKVKYLECKNNKLN